MLRLKSKSYVSTDKLFIIPNLKLHTTPKIKAGLFSIIREFMSGKMQNIDQSTPDLSTNIHNSIIAAQSGMLRTAFKEIFQQLPPDTTTPTPLISNHLLAKLDNSRLHITKTDTGPQDKAFKQGLLHSQRCSMNSTSKHQNPTNCIVLL